jgi:hypothetical protein
MSDRERGNILEFRRPVKSPPPEQVKYYLEPLPIAAPAAEDAARFRVLHFPNLAAVRDLPETDVHDFSDTETAGTTTNVVFLSPDTDKGFSGVELWEITGQQIKHKNDGATVVYASDLKTRKS